MDAATAIIAAFEFTRIASDAIVVSLAALRSEASRWFGRDLTDVEWMEGLRFARVNEGIMLHSFDGRHGKLSDSERAAPIEESGRKFTFAARRDVEMDD